MVLEIKKQDLMTADAKYVICHCISADCAMGAGVVVPIRKKYKGIKERCRVYVGEAGVDNAVGTAYRDVSANGVVYNLFSKRYVYQNAEKGMTAAEYHNQLRQCLISMREQMLGHGEKFLAMPKIACGLDMCLWDDVEMIITEVFGTMDIEILVCVL